MLKHIISFIVLFSLIFAAQIVNAQSEVRNLSPKDFIEEMESKPGVIIDVRTQREHDRGHLKITDYHFDLLSGDFEDALDDLDKEETYYLYCRTGNRSGQAAQIMIERGFENVFNIGGFSGLQRAGLEAE